MFVPVVVVVLLSPWKVSVTALHENDAGDMKACARTHTDAQIMPHHAKPHAGATVLVRMAPVPATATRYRSGMVSDANDDGGSPPLPLSYDVIYDETDDSGGSKGEQQGEEDDEEDGVEADRVLGVPSSPCVWCAARLNLARCSFRRGKQEEVRDGGRSLTMSVCTYFPPENAGGPSVMCFLCFDLFFS